MDVMQLENFLKDNLNDSCKGGNKYKIYPKQNQENILGEFRIHNDENKMKQDMCPDLETIKAEEIYKELKEMVMPEIGFLPWRYGYCVGMYLKKNDLYNGSPIILTEILSGCSIHIYNCENDNKWLIMHDARDIAKKKDYYNDNYTYRGQEILDGEDNAEIKEMKSENLVSFEYSEEFGYRFLKGKDVISKERKIENFPKNSLNYGATAFYYEDGGWNIIAIAADKNGKKRVFKQKLDDLMKKGFVKFNEI
jgi:hypothetical protein